MGFGYEEAPHPKGEYIKGSEPKTRCAQGWGLGDSG